MIPVEAPKANPENLLSLVQASYEAKVVLPEFQRSFVWGRDDIDEFLTSILQGYFVGTFLLLDTPSDAAMFPYRTVEGLEKVNGNARPADNATVRLVLDGQQRITSVFYALYEPDIPLRNTKYPYRFFLQLEPALEGNVDDAVVGISTWDRRRMSEIEGLLGQDRALPFSLLRDSSAFHVWLYKQQRVWDSEDQERIRALYDRFQKFMVPVVSLATETGKENIVNIFERINRTGISLSLFDLLAARLYMKGLRLRDLWKAFEKQHKQHAAQVVTPEFVLKVITLLEGREPRKANLLELDELDASRFSERWNEATEALAAAYERVSKEYGVFDPRWVPYTTLLVPLAVFLYELRRRTAAADAYRKLDCWYWSNVFGQRYDSAVDTKSMQDTREVMHWIEGGPVPEWIARNGEKLPELAVDEPRSAVYRGVMCLIARKGARDFLTGQRADLHQCDDDHVFPRSLYKKQDLVNTALNRSVIWDVTNRKRKSNKQPSEFMQECLGGHGGDEDRLLETLATHFIDAGGYAALHANDFDRFTSARRRLLEAEIRALVRV